MVFDEAPNRRQVRPFPGARSPLDPAPPKVHPTTEPAGGLAAVLSSLRYVRRETGLRRGLRVLRAVNQTGGFDCPSCAWPDPADRSIVEFCENGARAVADEATLRRVTPAFFAEHAIDDLQRRSDRWLNAQGRITHPMIRRAGASHYEPLSWDEAIGRVAEVLGGLDDPNRAVFYTSGRTSNEAAFLYQLFARSFGTNNLPDCSNMCHESSGTGLSQVIGVGKGTVLLEDFERADAIFLIGQNPGTNHPRMLSTLRAAKRRGATIVTMNPVREAALLRFRHPQHPEEWVGRGTEISDLYLPVRIGGDLAVLTGIMKAMLEAERRAPGTVFDHAFIEAHTEGFDDLVAHLDAVPWQTILDQGGVPEDAIRAAAKIAIESKATIACWAMGITQHEHGVANVQTIVDFLLLRGMIGKPGAGACPVRGHSNVQGDRTMGIWEKPPPWIGALERRFGLSFPRATGFDTVGAILAMERGDVDVFFALGGNFLSAAPDTDRTAAALAKTALTVQVSTKLNRSHLVTGREALILPVLGRTERDEADGHARFVTVENSMGIVHPSRGTLPPASPHLLPEPVLVARLARATLGDDHPVPWERYAEDYDAIRDLIAEVVPGFDDMNRRVREPGGFVLPNAARGRRFETPSKKARFTVHPIPEIRLEPDEFLMATVRAHDQFNTTVYDEDDRYRGVEGGRNVVFVPPADLARLGIEPLAPVRIESRHRGVVRAVEGFRAVPMDLPPRCVVTYFPEANPLVPVEHHAWGSRTPASKSVRVRLVPMAGRG